MMSGSPARGNSRGFSLVELLTVISIAGILAVLTVPAMQGLQQSGNFNRSLYALSDSLNLARSYAMANNTYVYAGLTEVDCTQSTLASPQVNNGVGGRVILSIVATKDGTSDSSSWSATGANLVQVRQPQIYDFLKKDADVDAFNKKIASIITKNSGDTTRSLYAMRFSDIYLHDTFNHGTRISGRDEYVKLFSLIAVFILIIACINFMNLSTAKASGRMKEVGVKKVVGAGRANLIIQFLSESVLMAVFTTVLAVCIAWLLLPQFNLLTGKEITLHFNGPLILTLLSITIFTGIVSGSYPALYLSKFNPLAILKGKFNPSFSELIARKGLVVFQFTISVMLIVAVLVVYQQIQFIQSTTPGYNKENVIRFTSEGRLMGNEDAFAAELKNLPGVVNASFTT